MFTQEDRELIEDFLLDRIAGKQELRLRQRRQDAEFERTLQREADLIAAIRAEGRESLRMELKAIEAARHEAPEPVFRPLWLRLRWVGLVAAVLALIGVTYLWMKPGPMDLYARYFSPYPNDLYPPQRSESATPTPQQEALYYYDAGDYPKAIGLISQLYERDPAAVELLFFRGNAYLAAGNWHLAVKDFQVVQTTPRAPYQAESYWYEALAYLQGGQYGIARSQLSRIAAEPRNPFHDQAERLLKRMR